MKNGAIIKTISKRLKTISSLTDLFHSDCSVENIHSLRVAVKKLRAFLNLLNIVNIRDAYVCLSTDLKHLYDLCGEARSMQLHQEQINSVCLQNGFTVPVKYMEYLKNRETLYMHLLDVYETDTGLNKYRIIKNIKGNINEDDLEIYFASVFKNLNFLVSLPLDDKNLHEIRRVLKELLYNYQVLLKRKNKLPLQIDIEKLDDITGALGDYQDYFSALYLIWYYLVNYAESADALALEPIREVLLQQKIAFKVKVSKQLLQLTSLTT